MEFAIVATIAAGLWVDQHFGAPGQVVVSAFTWLLLALLVLRTPAPRRVALAACLLFATAGEVVLSLVWGLYEYRQHNIPLFVPPGHVLLFFLGMRIAQRLPDRTVPWIAGIALPLVAGLAWTGRDTLGPVLFALFVACLWLSPSRKLYATMFVLSLAMELYGTALGNWRWTGSVAWLGLTTMNPPLAAGAFYCVLDLLVVSLTSRRPVRLATQEGR